MDSTQAPTKGDRAAAKADGGKSPRKAKGARSAKSAKPAKAAKAGPAPTSTKADEVLEALRAASRDKDIGFDRLVAALEEAIATAARKVYKSREMAARFDAVSGTLTAWTPYRIVEQKTRVEAPTAAAIDPDDIPLGQAAQPAPAVPAEAEPEKEIRLPYVEVLLDEAHALLSGELAGQSWQIVRHPEGGAEEILTPEQVALGDEIRLYRSTEGLGRIAAQSAKQVLYQKVREAERENIYNEYYPKLGELITGTVKRFERGDMIVDLGRTEAVIPRDHQSRAERYTQGERVRAVLVDVHKNPKGAQLVLSRTAPELLMQLMRMEVPEIYDQTVIIRGCVRQPGDRAKVAVASRERDVDPVGACVGMRGARVQAIMRELRGERIDIIQFSDDLVTYAQNALAPAKITRVSVMPGEEEEAPDVGPDGEALEPLQTLECIVEEDQLSLAIGKRGQNVRLAAALIGAKIELKSEQAVKAEVAEALQRMLLSSQRRATELPDVPGVEAASAAAFVAAGLATAGDVLEAESGADEEKAKALAALTLPEAERDAVLDAVQEFDQAPPPEPEPEEEAQEMTEDGSGPDQEDGTEAAAPATSAAETPEK
ncbi:MAG: transcription termination factor NusA [Thermoanaerobaculia bacterium]